MHETLCKDVKGYIDSETSGWCFHNGNKIFPLRIKTSEEILDVDVVERPDVGKVYALSCAFNSGWRIKTPVNGTLEMQIDDVWTPIFNLKKKATKKPTICFATMCKNEEHCIRDTLESVYKYIDYWVVHDTGSTDKTCEIVKAFFEEKNIPGELFIDQWEGFDVNKTKLFERCYKKTDYILHLDADDLLCGNFSFTSEDFGYLKYLITTKRGNAVYKCAVIFDNSVHWKLLGVAHTLIKNTDNPESLLQTKDLSDRDFYYESRDTGKRSEDPEKYLKDALRLKDQFYRTLLDDTDNLNSRSLFYMAQSYYDQGMFLEAAQYYSLYTKLKNTWKEEEFESNLRMITCFIKLKYPIGKILDQANKTIEIFPDRAEPIYIIGKHLNDVSRTDLAYAYLKAARTKSLSEVKKKYTLFINQYQYGKYVNDELAVACFWTKRHDEAITLINEIIDDPEFANRRTRLAQNLEFSKKAL